MAFSDMRQHITVRVADIARRRNPPKYFSRGEKK